ncbi:hypothetical protein BH23ACT7_BH23ACT7_16470 [soil metagenome]
MRRYSVPPVGERLSLELTQVNLEVCASHAGVGTQPVAAQKVNQQSKSRR